jgi:hypothetical protein
MANTVQLGGPLGGLVDPTNGQQVQGQVWGTCTYDVAPGVDPRSVEENVKAQLLQAAKDVIAHKLATNQVALPTLAQSMPHFLQEIVAQAGLDRLGARVVGIELSAQVDQAAPQQMMPQQQMPPNPYEATKNAFAQKAQERLDPSNYEVRAKINVGGLKIGMSSDGGLDTKGLETQLKNKAKSEIIWYGIGCAILLVVVGGLGGLGLFIYYAAKSGSSPSSTGKPVTATWDGKSTFNCGGNDVVKIEKVTSKLTSGSAIEAGGNCKLELVNVNISAPIAIKAGANAIVTVTGGTVEGTTYAVQGLGSSQVKFSGTKVTGKNQTLGGAKVTGP